MCCIFFSLSSSPPYTLVIASNRDEFLARSTAQASWHSFPSPTVFRASPSSPSLAVASSVDLTSNNPSVKHYALCGIDAHPSGGGTWLGVTRDGRWGALTNYTEAGPPPAPASLQGEPYRSRGQLVKDWLRSSADVTLEEYVRGIAEVRDQWPGFNVLLGQVGQKPKLAYITNRTHSGDGTTGDALHIGEDGLPGGVEWIIGGPRSSSGGGNGSGVDGKEALSTTSCGSACSGGLSNSVLTEPWAKVTTGRQRFDECVARAAARKDDEREGEAHLIEDLFEAMESSPGPVTTRTQMRSSVLIPPLKLPMHSASVPAAIRSESRLLDGPHSAHLDPAAPAAPAISRSATPLGFKKGGSASGPKTAWYATRTSTVILVRESGEVSFVERDVHVLDADGMSPTREGCGRENERRFDFRLVEGAQREGNEVCT